MDNEMIERARQAAIKSWESKRFNQIDVINAMILDQEIFTDIIKAMREPTEKMMVEMENAEPQLECFLEKEKSPSYLVWTAAIDAITND